MTQSLLHNSQSVLLKWFILKYLSWADRLTARFWIFFNSTMLKSVLIVTKKLMKIL